MPVKNDRNAITPTVPPMTANAPAPNATSPSSRNTSRLYRRSVRGVQAIALT